MPHASADTVSRALAEYDRRRATEGAAVARTALSASLAGSPEKAWLEGVRALVLRAEIDAASALCAAALAEHPDSLDLRYALAGLYRQSGNDAEAESLLRELIARDPDHVAATFLLARLLKDQGRMKAAADAVRALFRTGVHDANVVIQAVELLDDCGRKEDAAAIVGDAIGAGSTDPRLYAYAAMLDIQLGEFQRARSRYAFVLAHSPHAFEWQAPHGLAMSQRYDDANHPDFALFREGLARSDLSDKARASLLFALGKALDDVGDIERAAQCFDQGNAIARTFSPFSRKDWRRRIEARLAAKAPAIRLDAPDWTPVFVVGVPRSGTTVVADRLSRHADVCNRGELPWLPFLAAELARTGAVTRERMEATARTYAAQLRQDDSTAHGFIDKQPFNLLHVDLILALFPNAKIIHCRRNARDTALSLWQQFFLAAEQNFAYDFADIAAVIQGCERVIARWLDEYPGSILSIRYEDVVADSEAKLAEIVRWLGLPAAEAHASSAVASPAISTSSLWQARQPVYSRSVGRWKAYATWIPELLKLPDA